MLCNYSFHITSPDSVQLKRLWESFKRLLTKPMGFSWLCIREVSEWVGVPSHQILWSWSSRANRFSRQVHCQKRGFKHCSGFVPCLLCVSSPVKLIDMVTCNTSRSSHLKSNCRWEDTWPMPHEDLGYLRKWQQRMTITHCLFILCLCSPQTLTRTVAHEVDWSRLCCQIFNEFKGVMQSRRICSAERLYFSLLQSAFTTSFAAVLTFTVLLVLPSSLHLANPWLDGTSLHGMWVFTAVKVVGELHSFRFCFEMIS